MEVCICLTTKHNLTTNLQLVLDPWLFFKLSIQHVSLVLWNNSLPVEFPNLSILCVNTDATNFLKVVRNSFLFSITTELYERLIVCSKRLLLLVDSQCCNNLSTYQLLYSHWHFGCHGNLTGPQIHPISGIQLHFTQKVAGKLPFLLHQNCLHIKEHFLRKF